jgi:hypothetical protein
MSYRRSLGQAPPAVPPPEAVVHRGTLLTTAAVLAGFALLFVYLFRHGRGDPRTGYGMKHRLVGRIGKHEITQYEAW